MDTASSRVAVYTRMSYVLDDDQTKVADQERRCRELAAACGLQVGPVYCDNNRSAWQRNRKRPGWDAMLAAVKAGRIDTIVTYHGDRIIRQPRDLETLIELAESKGIRILSVSGTRDLDNADDRYIMRIDAAGACRSSDDASRRKKMQLERWRREGRTSTGGRGGRPFGFGTDGVAAVPAEQGLIREMARRVLAGESSTSLARALTARGCLTPAGNAWTHDSLRKMLARPRMAGLMPDGEAKAAWEPVLERGEWEALRAVLDARGAMHPSATSARRWLLPGIAACGAPDGDGECGGLMRSSRSGDNRPVYSCSKCHRLNRSAVHLDAYVTGRVLGALADDGTPEGRAPAAPDMAPEWKRLAAERAATAALVTKYAASPGRIELLMERLDGIDARMAQLRELEAADAGARLRDRYRGITLGQWEALPLEARRALVAACLTVTVLPASKRGPGFRSCDLRVTER